MDSDEDYQSLSPPKQLSPQVQFRRLKRLKKSDNKLPNGPLFDSTDDPILFSHVDFAELEALENDSEPQILDESNSAGEENLSQDSPSLGVGNEVEGGDEMELGIRVEEKKTKRMLEFVDDAVVGSGESGGATSVDGGDFSEEKEQTIGEENLLEKKELKKKDKKRRKEHNVSVDEERIGEENLPEKKEGKKKYKKRSKEDSVSGDEERLEEENLLEKKEEKKKNKKRMKEKTVSGDELKTSPRGYSKRREEKERRAYLTQLHAESQKLLRETGDASFKPIPVVQKPISSVLEKIRKRKLEISKKSNTVIDSYHGFELNSRPRDGMMDLDRSNILEENAAIPVEKKTMALSPEVQCSLAASNVGGDADKLTIHENAPNQMQPAIEELTPAFRAPVDDTQDLFDDSEPIDATAAQDDQKPNSPLEEDFAPSLQAMNLKLDSGPVDDSSSEEEDNDKENLCPHPSGIADNSSPNDDPVKNFIDEEAEEEDDSDNDLNRFQENEADEDIDDIEELNDMIATEYEERPTDKERRNELHQKWLEQQDAAGTDNLMQRLKCGSVLKDTFLSDNEPDTDEDDEKDEEIDDETQEDSLPQESGRINIKKAKEIILQLYSDKEEKYFSDEDDDMQWRHAQCLIRKEEQAQIALPADDASSREVFGLIKNLNIASDIKRKPKALSIFDSVLKGGNSVQSSKSSFLGRVSNHHIPTSHKQGSATARSFIFGRDDSNSRSSISLSEEGSSDSVLRDKQPTKNITTRYSSSQTKVVNQSTDSEAETMSRTSLLEILKRSSSRSKVCNEESGVDLTKSIFGFRVPKKPTKIQGRS